MKKFTTILFASVSFVAVSQSLQRGAVHVFKGSSSSTTKYDIPTVKKTDTTTKKNVQTTTDTVNGQQVFSIVQEMPRFNGDLNQYLSLNIQYPDSERVKGIQGTVYVNFIVEKDGSISNVKIIKGVANGPGFDKESIRVISSMPKWSVGRQNGYPVRVSYNIPIHYQLN